MRPVSQAFLAAVHASHTMRVEAIAVTPGQTGVTPTGTPIPVLDGDVTHDGTADVRGTLSLVTTPDLWPHTAGDLLAPYGQEIFVRRGVEFGDRRVEWVSLGYYRIDSPEQDDAPDGEITITGSDRMAGIVDARMLAPRQFGLGTTVQAVFETLIQEVYPAAAVSFDFDASAVVLNRSVVVEEDRYAFLRDLATAQAKDFYVDHEGRFRIADRPDPAAPVWEIATGERGVLLEVSRSISRDGIYNAVVATGEGADVVAPVSAIAYDANPASPTRWGGPFGKVPRFYSSPFVTTGQQARAAARKILADSLGTPYSLDLATVPNPALEVFDPVRVRTRDHDYTHTLQQVTIGLTPARPVTAATADQTVLDISVLATMGAEA